MFEEKTYEEVEAIALRFQEKITEAADKDELSTDEVVAVCFMILTNKAIELYGCDRGQQYLYTRMHHIFEDIKQQRTKN